MASTLPSRNGEPLPPASDLEAGGGSKAEVLKDGDGSHMGGVDEHDEKDTSEAPASTFKSSPPRSLRARSRTTSLARNHPRHRSKNPTRSLSPAISSSPSRSFGEEEGGNPQSMTGSAAATIDVVASANVDGKEAAQSKDEGEETTHPPSTVPKHEPDAETIMIVVEPAAPVAPIDPASFHRPRCPL